MEPGKGGGGAQGTRTQRHGGGGRRTSLIHNQQNWWAYSKNGKYGGGFHPTHEVHSMGEKNHGGSFEGEVRRKLV